MTYIYYCLECAMKKEIDKPMSECSREEKCDKCNQAMNRIYTASSIKTSDGIKS